jgi:hypothetical protein
MERPMSAQTCAVLGEAFELRYSAPHRYVLPKNHDEASSFLGFITLRQYPHWFIEAAQNFYSVPRAIHEAILKLHSGDLQVRETRAWSSERRRVEGQAVLLRLAADLLNEWDNQHPARSTSLRSEQNATALTLHSAIQLLLHTLERDGYGWVDGKLQMRATDAK